MSQVRVAEPSGRCLSYCRFIGRHSPTASREARRNRAVNPRPRGELQAQGWRTGTRVSHELINQSLRKPRWRMDWVVVRSPDPDLAVIANRRARSPTGRPARAGRPEATSCHPKHP